MSRQLRESSEGNFRNEIQIHPPELEPGNNSITHSWSKSKLIQNDLPVESQNLSLKNEIKNVIAYFKDFEPKTVTSPYEGNSSLALINNKTFYFGCKSNNLICGALELKEKKFTMKFSAKGLRCAELIGTDEILLVKKKNSIVRCRVTLKIENSSNKLLDFDLKFLQKIKPSLDIEKEEVLYRGLKVLLGDSSFITLENRKNKSSVSLWSDFQLSNIIYSHSSPGIAFDVSEDSVYIVTSHEDFSVILFNKLSNEKSFIKDEKLKKISSVKITKKNTYFILGGSNIFVYNLYRLTIDHYFDGHSLKITSLLATDDERVLISGGNDGKIYVWDLLGNIEGFMLGDLSSSVPVLGKKISVKSLSLSSSGTVYSSSNNGCINGFKLPNLNQYSILKTSEVLKSINELFSCSSANEDFEIDGKYLNSVYALINNKLFSVDTRSGIVIKEHVFEYPNITQIIVDSDSSSLCVLFEQAKLNKDENEYTGIIFNYKTLSQQKSIKFQYPEISKSYLSVSNNFLLLVNEFQYTVLVLSENRELPPVIHKDLITTITVDKQKNRIFSGDKSGLIQINQIENLLIKSENVLVYFDSGVKNIWIDSQGVYLIALHEDFTVNIWETNKGLKVSSYQDEGLIDVKFPMRSEIMLCLSSNSISAFHVPSLIRYFSINLNKNPEKFCFVQDEEFIALSMSNEIYLYRNPFKAKEILPFGNLSEISSFYSKVINLVNGQMKSHDSFLNSWYVAPFGINILHLYAYLDLPELIDKAFDEDVGFLLSKSGYSPLDICLDLVYEDCLEVLYDKLTVLDPVKLWVLESSLIRLNLCPYFQVAKFYDIFLQKTIDTTMPKFYKSERELPIVVTSPDLLVAKERFMYEDEYSLEGKEIYFKQSFMKINMVPGSRDSILLARSIGETTNGELFNSEFFKAIIEEKWKKIRLILYVDAFIYLVYTVLITIYGITRVDVFLYISFAINIWLIIYESIELISNPIDFVRDKYNFNDVARAFLICFYFGKVMLGYEVSNLELAIVVLLSWFKAISYFRLINSTRYFINLLFAVVADSIPFFIFLLSVTLLVSLEYAILDSNTNGYWSYLKMSWEINIGAFNTTGFGVLTYLIFVVDTVVIPIVLVSLLVSIMTDSFDKVNSQLAWADGKEIITMVIEGENVMFWNRNKNEKEFVHLCFKKQKEAKDDLSDIKLRNKVNKIQDQSNDMMVEVQELNKKFDKLLDFVMGLKIQY